MSYTSWVRILAKPTICLKHEQQVARQLINDLQLWRKEVNAQMPVKNPRYKN